LGVLRVDPELMIAMLIIGYCKAFVLSADIRLHLAQW
jgi:hypothetical protein